MLVHLGVRVWIDSVIAQQALATDALTYNAQLAVRLGCDSVILCQLVFLANETRIYQDWHQQHCAQLKRKLHTVL